MTLQDKNISIYPIEFFYPDSDGKPMADNTLQAHWIVAVYDNLKAKYAERQHEVFVAADLLWYPVEGSPKERMAPDVLVVFGRPEGYRGSYRQWQEENVPLTVVFEIMSPSNSAKEMLEKKAFYEQHGVSEFIILDPEKGKFSVYIRENNRLEEVILMSSFWKSPQMGIEIHLVEEEIQIFHEDGRRFKTFAELQAEKEQIAAEKEQIAAEKKELQSQHDAALQEIERLKAQLKKVEGDPEV